MDFQSIALPTELPSQFHFSHIKQDFTVLVWFLETTSWSVQNILLTQETGNNTSDNNISHFIFFLVFAFSCFRRIGGRGPLLREDFFILVTAVLLS